MPGGRPKKPPSGPSKAPKATRTSAPEEVRPELVSRWDAVIRDLEAVGVLTDTDLIRLARAFRQLGNAVIFQTELVATLENPVASPSDKTKFQSAITSATSSFNAIVADVERAVRLRPKPETGSKLDKILGGA